MSDERTDAPAYDQLATALAKAQATISGSEKSRVNPAFRSAYSTLADVWDACREPLTSNGLSVAQLVRASDAGVEVETILLHASGQSLSSTLVLPVSKRDAQGIGSAISYGRRYGLAAMVGVAPDDDDDGNAAANQGRREEPQRYEPRKPAPPPEVDEKALDSDLVHAVKAVTALMPEQNASSLRKMAGMPAAPAKLTTAQKQIFLRALQQKMNALENADDYTSDQIPGPEDA